VWHALNLFDWQTAKKIVAFCEEHQIDRVETHNLIGISMQVPRYLRKAGIPHHHYLHDVQLVEPSGILSADHVRDSFAQRLYSLLVRRLFGSPAVVYSPTRFLKEFYRQRGFFPESEWKVEHEIISQKSKVKSQSLEDMKRYLFVGSLVEHKGVRQLLNAWNPEELVTRYSVPVNLTIVGDGPLRSFVEAASTNDTSIHYLGRLPHEDLDAIYASHDVLVFPSQCIENRPNVIAEAMAHGLEIIAVRTGGVAEMVEGYTAVRLIAPTESISL
jgi:glycosyltransferase involved in cell wall biosynthesis